MIWDALQGLDVPLVDHRVPGYRGMRFEPCGILIHHTAAGGTADLPSLNICCNGRHDLPGPLCQILIGRTGTVAIVTDGYANHAGEGSYPGVKNGNRNLIGVELENNGTGEPWSARQIAVAAKVTARLRVTFGDLIIGHKEWAPGRKVDPSFDMDGFRQTVRSLRPLSTGEDMPLTEQDLDAVAARVWSYTIGTVRDPGAPAKSLLSWMKQEFDGNGTPGDNAISRIADAVSAKVVVTVNAGNLNADAVRAAVVAALTDHPLVPRP